MKFQDKIHGSVQVNEKVLIDIIESQVFQRLKFISQSGIPDELNYLNTYSRYEHSLGVLALLKQSNATVKEQIAGLLHDISHLAFSHLAEWVFEKGIPTETHNEDLLENYINSSEIKTILLDNNFDPTEFYDLKQFKLLKSKMPNANADRIDYGIRDYYLYENKKEAIKILNSIQNNEESYFFNSKEEAREFADMFLLMQIKYYSSAEGLFRYYIFSRTLKKALAENIISKDDFWGPEESILEKLFDSNDKIILGNLELLKEKNLENHFGIIGYKLKKKFRYIIPKIYTQGKFVLLTDIDKDFEAKLKDAQKNAEEGIAL